MIGREWSCWNPLTRKPAHLEEKYILTVGLKLTTEVDLNLQGAAATGRCQ